MFANARPQLTDQARQSLIDFQEDFISHLAINRNLSSQTVRAYASDLAAFSQWLVVQEVDTYLLGALPGLYVAALSPQGLARSTLARKLSCLKTYFKFLMKESLFPPDALPLRFHRPKNIKRLPDFLNPQEVQQLLQTARLSLAQADIAQGQIQDISGEGTAEKTDPAFSAIRACLLALRNLAIVEVLFSSGLRVSELVQLNFGQVDWQQGELRILGKGGRERIAFISASALHTLLNYKSRWRDLSGGALITPKSPLFLNYTGSVLDVRSVRRMLNALAKTAGIEKPVHPHLFRHSFATHLLNHGVDLRIVQELLGHVSIRSTQIYTHISTERLKRAYLKAHPRANQGAGSARF